MIAQYFMAHALVTGPKPEEKRENKREHQAAGFGKKIEMFNIWFYLEHSLHEMIAKEKIFVMEK